MSPDHYLQILEERNRALRAENADLKAAIARVRDLLQRQQAQVDPADPTSIVLVGAGQVLRTLDGTDTRDGQS